MSPFTNRRRDSFGGSTRAKGNILNRLKFPLRVLDGIREKCGKEFPIFVKFNVHDGFDQGGFSGAVGTDDSGQGSFGNFKVNAVENRLSMIGNGEVVDFQRLGVRRIHGRFREPSASTMVDTL